jgi:hypothetical protein
MHELTDLFGLSIAEKDALILALFDVSTQEAFALGGRWLAWVQEIGQGYCEGCGFQPII